MRSLGQLLLNLLVNFQILLKVADLLNQLLILKYEFLRLFGLEFQLTCELMVLQNCQFNCSIKLLFFKG